MPAAPASFLVKFDLTGTPKLVLTDDSGWTVLEKPDAKGYFSITLPDGIERVVDFTTPDIEWDGSELPPFEHTLRLNSQGNVQCGTYTIKYYTNHPSYTVGSLTRIFTFQYSEVDLDVEKDFDTFTPSLFYRDNTIYSRSGYTTTTNTVAWTSSIASVGVVNGSADDFDLAYLGGYYTGIYTTSFQRNILYTNQSNSWLTIAELYTYSSVDTILAPPTIGQMLACLDALWLQLDAASCNCTLYTALKAKFEYGASLYTLILGKIQAGDYDGLTDIIETFQALLSCTGSGDLGVVIDPYDVESATRPPADIVFAVGAASYMVTGATSKTVTTHIGWRLRVKRNKLAESDFDDGSGTYYGWDSSLGALTITALTAGETIRLEAY
jgi:hypothetical protein